MNTVVGLGHSLPRKHNFILTRESKRRKGGLGWFAAVDKGGCCMCKLTLLSAKRALNDFIKEAKLCASEGKGFASILTKGERIENDNERDGIKTSFKPSQ
jgi:hypothetical protein